MNCSFDNVITDFLSHGTRFTSISLFVTMVHEGHQEDVQHLYQ